MENDFNQGLLDALPGLKRYAFYLTAKCANKSFDSESLVQDTILRALERKHQFQDGTNLRNWLARLMHNLHCSSIRKSIVWKEMDNLDFEYSGLSYNSDVYSRITLNELKKVKLTNNQKLTLQLCAVEGHSVKETAAIEGVAVGTILSRLARARAELNRFFA